MQLRALIIGAAVFCALQWGLSSAATEPAAEALHSTCKLRIAPQSLDSALQEVARQCGIQTIYFAEITNGLTAPGLNGSYSIDAALHRLLDPAGLAFRYIDTQTIEIRTADAKSPGGETTPAARAAPPTGLRTTQRSAAANASIPEVIINGTAEGLVATRTETPLQDIAQTVSIIPAEQIRQQNNVTVGDALADAVGITVTQQDTLNQSYFSRGFEITNYTLDGGASLHSLLLGAGNTIGLFFQIPDLSEFDRIEVLRGSDALFGANGTPGGTLNLVRKRPLSERRLMFNSSVGSWSNYREEIDVTGPLGFGGALRGRLDGTFAQRHYFYDGANNEHKSVFAVVDYDLAPDTTLTMGGSYRWERSRPFEGGLPQFSDGRDARLPRGTAFTLDWSRFDTQTREVYLRLDHQIQGTWHLQLNASLLSGSVRFAYGEFFGPVDPVTHALGFPPGGAFSLRPGEHDQLTGEITVTGREVWLGVPVDIAFGGDHTHTTAGLTTVFFKPFGVPLENVYAFNPATYPDPIPNDREPNANGQASSNLQTGLFASLKVQPLQWWSFTAGLRISNEKTTTTRTVIVGGAPYAPVASEYEYVGKITPFIATEFRINDAYSVYASYADIYRSNQGFATIGGKLLSAADGIDVEAGVKGVWQDGKLHGALTIYRIVQRGSPDLDQNAPLDAVSYVCCFFPSAKSRSQGIDLELHGTLSPGWLVGGGYSYNSTSETANESDPNGQFQSPQTPRHLLKVWTSLRLPGHWQRWTVGGTLLAQTSNFSPSYSCPASGECDTLQSITSVQRPYAVVSPRIGYRIDEHWQLALTANNIFDKHYYQTIGRPQEGSWYGDPRNYLLRMDAQF